MKYTMENRLRDIVKTKRGRSIVAKYMPQYEKYPNSDYSTLIEFWHNCPLGIGITPENIEEMLAELNAPIVEDALEMVTGKSLDDIDNASYFQNGETLQTPFDGEAECCFLQTTDEIPLPDYRNTQCLDDHWRLAFDREGKPDWNQAMDAPVPGSIHTALVNAGIIPDTTFGRNQEIALSYSYKDWWYRTSFHVDDTISPARLVFDGICNRCEIYLNGVRIGSHEGMFGGPVIDVTGKLLPENELIVRLFMIPFHHQGNWAQDPSRSCDNVNDSWRNTVVINNVYGWHYSCLPSLGIWNHVRLEYPPQVALVNPFISTIDAQTGLMELAVEYASSMGNFEGKLSIQISPDNFTGNTYILNTLVSGNSSGKWLYNFHIPNPKLWWPNLLGEQNLYKLTVSIQPDSCSGESVSVVFGIRTVRMAPLRDGSRDDHYNWRFIINGKSAFIRGTGWCTMDAMLDFSKSRYDRFLKLAHIQNCQMLRAWGCGMPETDVFYTLCDRYGIMVMQEWPTAWNSHLDQPYEMLSETVQLNTVRIRNHASLILYCSGNESNNPYGEAIDMMGRYSFTLDGTRTFHRGEPFGGSIHNYESYWGRQSLDAHANLEGDFFGEFGLACMPCAESVNRYLPKEEQNVWPSKPYSAFEYHTPIFGTAYDLSLLRQTAGYFAKPDCSFEDMINGSQLAQIAGVRHTLERARIRYPYCGGALYYKLNDNFPAMSWSSIDWYGAPKLSHYVFQKSFASAAALIWVDTLNFAGLQHKLPIYVADDFADPGIQYEVHATVFNHSLQELQKATYTFTGDVSNPEPVGTINIAYEESNNPPIFIHITLFRNGKEAYDTFYFFNFQARPGCMFDLPATELHVSVDGNEAVLKNVGSVPAVGAMVIDPGHMDTFTAMENFIWLDPGKTKRIPVDHLEALVPWALNARN